MQIFVESSNNVNVNVSVTAPAQCKEKLEKGIKYDKQRKKRAPKHTGCVRQQMQMLLSCSKSIPKYGCGE